MVRGTLRGGDFSSGRWAGSLVENSIARSWGLGGGQASAPRSHVEEFLGSGRGWERTGALEAPEGAWRSPV